MSGNLNGNDGGALSTQFFSGGDPDLKSVDEANDEENKTVIDNVCVL